MFSLANWIRYWGESGIAVSVLNFYTMSEYAPWAILSAKADRENVTNVRAREDRVALFQTSPAVKIRSYGLMDAPVRLGQEVVQIMGAGPEAVRDTDTRELMHCMGGRPRASVFVSPLGLGGHIDHLTVRAAALSCIPPHQLAFYQDLPYATWTGQPAIRQAVAQTNSSLKPITLTHHGRHFSKRRLVARYRSQIRREDTILIAGYRETLWVPANSSAWISLLP